MVTDAREDLRRDLEHVDKLLEGLERASLMQKGDAARAVLVGARSLLGKIVDRITALEGATKGNSEWRPPGASGP